MAMLDTLTQLRKLCVHVRYTGIVRRWYDRVMSSGAIGTTVRKC